MKKRYFAFCFSLLLLASCDKPGADGPLAAHLLEYNWRITYMEHLGQDETALFQDYIFDFSGDDVIIANSGDTTVQGTWYRSNASEDNPKIVLDFGSDYPLSLLNYDWQQELRTDDTIRFVDEMASQSSETVVFTRIP